MSAMGDGAPSSAPDWFVRYNLPGYSYNGDVHLGVSVYTGGGSQDAWILWLWIASLGIIIGLSAARSVFHDKPIEDRRLAEIQQLIRDSQHVWTQVGTSSEEAASSEGDEAKTCSTCLDPFSEGDLVLKLPCGHDFHTSCVEKWFNSTAHQARTCPTCRQNPLVSDAEFALTEEEQTQEARRAAHMRNALRDPFEHTVEYFERTWADYAAMHRPPAEWNAASMGHHATFGRATPYLL